MFHEASQSSVLAFVAICMLVVGAFLGGAWSGARRESRRPLRRMLFLTIATFLWLAVLAAVVESGRLEGDARRVVFFMALVNLVSLAVGLSPVGRWLRLLPVAWLVAFQGFRLPLELVLHSWVNQGVIPATMTWTGRNWDILSGILALVLAPFCRRSKAVAWLANVVGLGLLLNVMRVAMLSSPVPFGWPVTPKLELVFHLPYALIVPVCIGGALIGHVALTRALLAKAGEPRA